MRSSLAGFLVSISTALFACTIPASAVAAASATVPAAAIPIADFFANATLSGAVMSPDGRHVAVLVSAKGGRTQLYLVELPGMKVRPLTSFDDADISQVSWVNPRRVVYSVMDRNIAQGDVRYGPGLYAINIDGSGYRQLVSNTYSTILTRNTREVLGGNTRLLATGGRQDTDDVYVTNVQFSTTGTMSFPLLKLNTVTGVSKVVATLADAQGWLLDQQDEVRIALVVRENKRIIYYRDNAQTPWRKLRESDIFQPQTGDFTPAFFDAKGNFYVQAEFKGAGAVYRYDLASNAILGEPLANTPGYDFAGIPVQGSGKLLGLRFESDAPGTIWFDKNIDALQAKIDALLPATINTLAVANQPETPFISVTAASDVQPPMVFIFNTDTEQLIPVGSSHPAIDPLQMSRKQQVRYQARDGLSIPAYLTLPKGAGNKNLPMVVMVHGGPWVRGGHWDWNRETQFLASRGYAVLEPDYRGSTGYGDAHFKAGWKQWGLKMQDDIADGARWAIAKGYADPQRICIAGASYGGYATLMGLLNDRDLFKCGINWVGVSDINMMRDGHWTGDSDLSDAYKKSGMKDMVGDAVADAAQLKATSPLQQAARISQPLLLGYGGADRRVPASQGRLFYEEVSKTNPDVEWVLYPEEGHGWVLQKTNVDFWGRAEKLLQRTIGKGAP